MIPPASFTYSHSVCLFFLFCAVGSSMPARTRGTLLSGLVGLKLLLLAATVATAGPPSTNAPASGTPCHEDEDDDAFAGREQERSDLHSEDDDDGDQEPSASPEVAAAAGRRRTANQRCVYADEQKELVRACRRCEDCAHGPRPTPPRTTPPRHPCTTRHLSRSACGAARTHASCSTHQAP